MKFSAALSTLLVLLPLLSPVSAQAGAQRNQNGNNGNNNQGNNNQDPQKSLTLDPRVIAPGFANNGQNPPVAGQVASLTSTNNFINFCLTVKLPITDGKQIQGGSCNPAPIGAIPSIDNMPSSKFVFPPNGGFVTPNQPFQIKMAIRGLVTGNFVNAAANYFSAPQQLNGAGQILGHSHVVAELLTSLTQTKPTNPRVFAFFKGLNAAGNELTADVTNGLPAGAYRICSINSSSNHQPVIVPVAQHGSLDDCIYMTSGVAPQAGAGAGQNNNNQNNGQNGQNGQNGAQNGQQNNGNNGAQNNGNQGRNNQGQNQGGGRGRRSGLGARAQR